MSYGNYPDLRCVRRVLVVKMRHLGDVLLSSALFGFLKQALPEATLDACIPKEALEMLEGHAAISRLHLYDRQCKQGGPLRRLGAELSLLRHIRKERYDLVINLTEGDRGALIALASGAAVRVGIDPQGKGFVGKSRVYTHLVKRAPGLRHAVERDLDAARRIGLFPSPAQRELVLHVPDGARESVRARLRAEQLQEGQFILIHPTSRWRFKCPPPHLVAQLIQQLSLRGVRTLLSSGPDPEELLMVQQILSQCEAVSCAGTTSLKELAALVAASRALITVDSMPLHMACALKVPVVALFGPSSEKNWGPWQHPYSCVVAQPLSCRPCFLDGCGGSKRSDCLHTLPVDRIIAGLDSVS